MGNFSFIIKKRSDAGLEPITYVWSHCMGSRGWADLPEVDSTDVLYVDELPFELLFPHLAAIVYHGGTGTMASAAREEPVSALRKNHCPESTGISVRFDQEYAVLEKTIELIEHIG